MSDYLDICLQSNTTPNEDVKWNVIGSLLDKTELDYTRDMLLADYGITLEGSEILDFMEDNGLDFGALPSGDAMHDTLYDILQEE